jgi:PAS domain S-box-containing protein
MSRANQHELTRALQAALLKLSQEYAFIYLDAERRIVGWGAAAQQVFGYTEEEVIGVNARLLFTPDDQALGLDQHELDVALADSRAEDDRWHVRKDGARIWVHGAVEAFRDDSGKLLGYVKVVRDRTDMRAQLEGLEREVTQATQRWDEGRQVMRTLGHEMRNPLGPLLNCAHILERSSSDPGVQKVAGIVRTQVSVLTSLAEDLLDVVRTERGKLSRQRDRVDLRDLVQEQAAASVGAAAERGVDLKVLVPSGPIWAEVDRGRIAQVLQNLVGNAVKYTPSGGHVWCKLTREGTDAVLRVQDTGIGIPAEELPRIFELFTRGAQATELEPGGLGVGLAIAQQVLQEHRGNIQARSGGTGKGSEFLLRLPSADPEPGLSAST